MAPPGIALHIDVDETNLPHQASWLTSTTDCWPLDFDSVRTSFYGTEAERADPNAQALLEAKARAYRYCIIADQSGPVHWGGCGGIGEDSFVLYVHNMGGVPDRHASSFMHELGHSFFSTGDKDGIAGGSIGI